MLIYPSILEKDAASLSEYLHQLLPVFDHFQLDVVDGDFVPGNTVPLDDVVKKLTKEATDFKEKTFEFHLMVRKYDDELKKIKKLGKKQLQPQIFHFHHRQSVKIRDKHLHQV